MLVGDCMSSSSAICAPEARQQRACRASPSLPPAAGLEASRGLRSGVDAVIRVTELSLSRKR